MADRVDDVAIVGGGPAGSTAALLLARWGRSVTLLTRPATGPTLAESLPPSCRRLFEAIGIAADVDAAGFFPSRGNTVWWGGGEARSEAFADHRTGYQVRARDLEELMVGLAGEAGATVRRDATVRHVELPGFEGPAALSGAPMPAARPPGSRPDPAGGASRVAPGDGAPHRLLPSHHPGLEYALRGSPKPQRLTARILLDCSGRAGMIARQGLRRHEKGAKTVALVGSWRRPAGWGLEDETHTLVESYEDGWVWSVPVSPEVRYFTAMVDPQLTGLKRIESGAPSERLEAMYRAELAKAPHLDALLADAKREQAAFGCDASLYAAHRYAGAGFLLVGDAASAINPLSSYGVKKALASAWVAAVVANTCLSSPELEGPALAFYGAREEQVWQSYQRTSARFFEEAAADHGHPFWTGRAHPADAGPEGATDELTVDALRQDPSVLAAFEALKRSPAIRLRPGPALERVEAPAIRGQRIVLETQLKTPQMPAVRFLRGVDLASLVVMAGDCDRVPDLFEAYNRANQPVVLPDFLGALSVLLAKGALVLS